MLLCAAGVNSRVNRAGAHHSMKSYQKASHSNFCDICRDSPCCALQALATVLTGGGAPELIYLDLRSNPLTEAGTQAMVRLLNTHKASGTFWASHSCHRPSLNTVVWNTTSNSINPQSVSLQFTHLVFTNLQNVSSWHLY